jgi:hypothetical protein
MRAIPLSRPSVLFSAVSLAVVAAILGCLMFSVPSVAQEAEPSAAAVPRPLITQRVDESQLTTLRGNTHPLARPEFDLGTAPASLPMKRMLLVLKRSPEQEAALAQWMDDQQNQSSPNYHKWLTPEQFGQQFGATDADLLTVTAWLQSHGFEVGSTKGRTVLEFSGSASQVQEAFHTSIHKYLVQGEQHWANASDPQIPAALTPAVAGLASLNNFPRKPMNHPFGQFVRDKSTGKLRGKPLFTFPGGCDMDNNCYAVSPYDFATIYNVLPLWTAGTSGQGQTIAIVGETNINPQDVTSFRSMFGLAANGFPANNVNIILNGPDPGIQGDESEADIDVQWSGAVAPSAAIDFVVSQSTESTAGIDLSAVYIVENNLAPVMSESYGYCELGLGVSGNQFLSSLWQQAAAQGITVFIASGDDGSAGCDFGGATPQPAQYGLAVSGFASTPYNVAVGGTDFNDIQTPSTYWSATNDPTTQASALGYIPETTWNDSCTNGILASYGWSANPETNCNDSRLSNLVWTVGGSGGKSSCTTASGNTVGSCSGGYAKPSWQAGTGVPNDGKRDVPDVSLFASNGFMGNFYVICQSDLTYGTCNTNSSSYFLGFGGTSVSSPAFAGIMALVNQQTGERQGNANYVLYKLAAQQPSAFHDLTSGTIAMPCATGSPNCSTTRAGDAYGILSGYSTTAGYDLATGLGSVNVDNLVTKWSSVSLQPSTTTVTTLTPTTITHGQTVNFSVTVKPQSGTGTPGGLVSLEGSPANSTQGIAGFTLSNGTISGSTDLLPGGSYSVIAHYPGDANFAASDSASVSVTVNKENSLSQAFLVTFDSNGNILSKNTTTAAYGTPYILRVNVENSAGNVCAPVSTSGATGCPTGSIVLTDNGNSLDTGTYALNSYGYFEDQTVQLPGGTDSVKAAYAGDNSFNSSVSTTPIVIIPASTTIIPVTTQPQLTVGQSYELYTTIQTTSSGVAPTGTVSFYANGTLLTGTVQYYGYAANGSQPAFLNASINTSFSTPGTKSLTAAYSGDTNYSASPTSTPFAVSVFYPTTVTLAPATQTVSAGSSVTLTALVDTNVKNLPPTGTVTFSGYPSPIQGTPTLTPVTDASGNSALQATLTITVNSTENVYVQYSGDSNYFANSSNYVSVLVPDFSLNANTGYVTLTAGQSQAIQIYVSDNYGFSSTVNNFSCSGLPAEATCSFSPTSVSGNNSITLTLSTAALGQFRKRAQASTPPLWWAATSGALLLGICLISVPISKRQRKSLLALFVLVSFVTLPSCGGGSGGGVTQPNNPVPAITTLSPTQMAAGSASQPLTVSGSGFISSSTVTLNGVSHPYTYGGSTQLLIPLSASDLASTGTFPVIVTNPTPGGGASSGVNFNVVTGTPTGTFNITVTATSGALTHSASFMLSVQ